MHLDDLQVDHVDGQGLGVLLLAPRLLRHGDAVHVPALPEVEVGPLEAAQLATKDPLARVELEGALPGLRRARVVPLAAEELPDAARVGLLEGGDLRHLAEGDDGVVEPVEGGEVAGALVADGEVPGEAGDEPVEDLEGAGVVPARAEDADELPRSARVPGVEGEDAAVELLGLRGVVVLLGHAAQVLEGAAAARIGFEALLGGVLGLLPPVAVGAELRPCAPGVGALRPALEEGVEAGVDPAAPLHGGPGLRRGLRRRGREAPLLRRRGQLLQPGEGLLGPVLGVEHAGQGDDGRRVAGGALEDVFVEGAGAVLPPAGLGHLAEALDEGGEAQDDAGALRGLLRGPLEIGVGVPGELVEVAEHPAHGARGGARRLGGEEAREVGLVGDRGGGGEGRGRVVEDDALLDPDPLEGAAALGVADLHHQARGAHGLHEDPVPALGEGHGDPGGPAGGGAQPVHAQDLGPVEEQLVGGAAGDLEDRGGPLRGLELEEGVADPARGAQVLEGLEPAADVGGAEAHPPDGAGAAGHGLL